MKFNLAICVVVLVFVATPGVSQQIDLSTPFHSASSSFHERLGVNFGFSLAGGQGPGSRVVGLSPVGQLTPNISFSQNGFGSTIPTFGGFDPNSGARFGFSRRSSNGGFSLGFDFSQGSTRTLTSTTPNITVLNGGVGTINSGFSSPFVTGITPVVGSIYEPDNAVTRAVASGQLRPFSQRERESQKVGLSSGLAQIHSSAAQGDLSVAEIRAQQARTAADKKAGLQLAIQEVADAEDAGDFRSARINLRKAIRLTDDPVYKRQLRDRLKSFSGR